MARDLTSPALTNREVRRLRRENAALRRAANALIDKYIANRSSDGTFPHPHEFIACVTPERPGFCKSSDRVWKLWDDLRTAIGEVQP